MHCQHFLLRCTSPSNGRPDSTPAAEVFGAIRACANNMANEAAQPHWRSACGQIICATRRAQELLRPSLQVEVVPQDVEVFTDRTASRHLQAPLAGSATLVTWSDMEHTQAKEEIEASDLPEAAAAGELTAERQNLEHTLLELMQHKSKDHPEIAAALREKGWVNLKAGDLIQAKSG